MTTHYFFVQNNRFFDFSSKCVRHFGAGCSERKNENDCAFHVFAKSSGAGLCAKVTKNGRRLEGSAFPELPNGSVKSTNQGLTHLQFGQRRVLGLAVEGVHVEKQAELSFFLGMRR